MQISCNILKEKYTKLFIQNLALHDKDTFILYKHLLQLKEPIPSKETYILALYIKCLRFDIKNLELKYKNKLSLHFRKVYDNYKIED